MNLVLVVNSLKVRSQDMLNCIGTLLFDNGLLLMEAFNAGNLSCLKNKLTL